MFDNFRRYCLVKSTTEIIIKHCIFDIKFTNQLQKSIHVQWYLSFAAIFSTVVSQRFFQVCRDQLLQYFRIYNQLRFKSVLESQEIIVLSSTVEPLQTETPENRKPLETEQFCQSHSLTISIITRSATFTFMFRLVSLEHLEHLSSLFLLMLTKMNLSD